MLDLSSKISPHREETVLLIRGLIAVLALPKPIKYSIISFSPHRTFSQPNIEQWPVRDDASFSHMLSDANTDIATKLGNTPIYDKFNFVPTSDVISAFNFDTIKADGQVAEIADTITLNTTYFDNFTISGTDSKKTAQTKEILRETLSQFPS